MPADPSVLRRELTALAARQAGYFTSAQALHIGYSYQSQKYHADRGDWARVRRGIFRIPDWPIGEDDTYVLWFLWSRSRGVVSHQSALVLHDLSDVNPSRVHLTVPPGFRSSDAAVVLHKQHLEDADVEDREGYRVTSLERTLLDAAVSDVTQEQLQGALSDAVMRGLVSARRLRARSDEWGSRAALRIERALGALEAAP